LALFNHRCIKNVIASSGAIECFNLKKSWFFSKRKGILYSPDIEFAEGTACAVARPGIRKILGIDRLRFYYCRTADKSIKIINSAHNEIGITPEDYARKSSFKKNK